MILHYNPSPLASPPLSIRVQAYLSLHSPTLSCLGRELMVGRGSSRAVQGVFPLCPGGLRSAAQHPSSTEASTLLLSGDPPMLFLPSPTLFLDPLFHCPCTILSPPNSSQKNILLMLSSHTTTSSEATHIQLSLLPDTTGVPILSPSHRHVVTPTVLCRVHYMV